MSDAWNRLRSRWRQDHACRRWPGMLELIEQRFLELAGKGRKGTRVMRTLLAERMGQGRFAQSGFEASTRRLVRAVGLPEPQLQHAVRDGSFVAYLDVAWPEIMFGLECDSLAWHSGKKAHFGGDQRWVRRSPPPEAGPTAQCRQKESARPEAAVSGTCRRRLRPPCPAANRSP
jgi:hypothetical protein